MCSIGWSRSTWYYEGKIDDSEIIIKYKELINLFQIEDSRITMREQDEKATNGHGVEYLEYIGKWL